MIWIRVLKKSKESITQSPDPDPLTPAKKALPQTSGIMLGDVSSHTHTQKDFVQGYPNPSTLWCYWKIYYSAFISFSELQLYCNL